jgi:hypothetical protein
MARSYAIVLDIFGDYLPRELISRAGARPVAQVIRSIADQRGGTIRHHARTVIGSDPDGWLEHARRRAGQEVSDLDQ